MPQKKKEDPLLLDKITAIIFTLIALMHVLRVFYQWQARIGLFTVPFSWSFIAVIIAGGLALSFWKRVQLHSSSR